MSIVGYFQISLDMTSSDKFCNLLRAALTALTQMLEVTTLSDIGKHAEELLNYLKSTVILEPTVSVLCVQQVSCLNPFSPSNCFSWYLNNEWQSPLLLSVFKRVRVCTFRFHTVCHLRFSNSVSDRNFTEYFFYSPLMRHSNKKNPVWHTGIWIYLYLIHVQCICHCNM